MRAFIAVELDPRIRDGLDGFIMRLRETPGADNVRWVPIENIHLTLKFLGNVPPASQEQIESAMSAAAARHQVTELRVGGLGHFPTGRRPRVLWIGARGPAGLGLLQGDIDAATAKLGFPREDRSYSPHLTIGRVRDGATSAQLEAVLEQVSQHRTESFGRMEIASIHLFSSLLTSEGAKYRRLHSADLVRIGET